MAWEGNQPQKPWRDWVNRWDTYNTGLQLSLTILRNEVNLVCAGSCEHHFVLTWRNCFRLSPGNDTIFVVVYTIFIVVGKRDLGKLIMSHCYFSSKFTKRGTNRRVSRMHLIGWLAKFAEKTANPTTRVATGRPRRAAHLVRSVLSVCCFCT